MLNNTWCQYKNTQIVYCRGRQHFPSRGPKTNSARYGVPN